MYGSRRANDGYRARIGVVIPSVNTVVEAWFALAAPPGVAVHVSRMPGYGQVMERPALPESVNVSVDAALSRA